MIHALLLQTRKEVRALPPWTAGVAVASVALAAVARQNAGFPHFHDQEPFFIMAYALGVLAVAALSVGHELTHGTLATLLVQPLDRLKVLRLKVIVLITALVSLGFLASAVFPHGYLPNVPVARWLLIWGPVAAGIGLVPSLTLLSRRPLGGVVFAVAIPGLFLVAGEQRYPLQQGFQALDITWYGTLAASAIGLAALFVQFRGLEVVGDGRARARASPAAQTGSVTIVEYRPTVRRPWVWLLIKKELRLQQMTFAVSGLYGLGAAALLISESFHRYGGPTFASISMIHACFVPLIAGALASAEERHIGTLAAQILQPRNVRLQWALKVAVTIGVTLALTIGLPLILMAVRRPVDPFRVEFDFAVGIGLLCAVAIYVSSISSNSLWALLSCFPLTGIALAIGGAGYRMVRYDVSLWLSHWLLGPRTERVSIMALVDQDKAMRQAILQPLIAASRDIDRSLSIIETSLIVAFGLLILYFAARNHRMLDRNLRTVSHQMLALLLFAAAAATAYQFLATFTWRLWW